MKDFKCKYLFNRECLKSSCKFRNKAGLCKKDEEQIQNLRAKIRKILFISDLTPREIKVLEMRFGIIDGYSKTLEEVGKEFGVTRERIRQIEAKTLDKIQGMLGDF